MRQVFLGGTTSGTTWRAELIERLVKRGVKPEQIINPHLPPGEPWTQWDQQREEDQKRDPNTIVLIYVCPLVAESRPDEHPDVTQYKSQLLGPTSMFEIGKYAYSHPERTAVVLDLAKFDEASRARKVLTGIARELSLDFHGRQPYFRSLEEAEEWLMYQLTASQ